MKSSIRILSVIFLTTVYCYAIGVVTKSLAHSDFQTNPTSSEGKIISDYSAKLFCHTSPSEISVNSLNNLPAKSFKISFADLWAIIKSTEQLFEKKLSQYITSSGNILINHQKFDIVFPFHYFW